MIESPVRIPKEYVSDISIDGMKGRMLRLPAPKNLKKPKTIVFCYGIHTSLERMYALTQFLNRYGEIIMPDLPGFGGMDSFYSIGKTPGYDEYADYLYKFLKSEGLTNNVWFISNSIGTQFKTRMLQKYPETVEWMAGLISLAGFVGGQNFSFKFPFLKTLSHALSYVGQTRAGVAVINAVAFNALSMRIWMFIFVRLKAKMQADDREVSKRMVQMELSLWSVGDHRTHARSGIMMFRDDLRRYKGKEKIHAKLYNVAVDKDQYFDNRMVKRDFEELYDEYEQIEMSMKAHSPSMIASVEEVDKMIPARIKKLLSV